MSDVKWIKISVDIFNDEKFDAIKTLPDSNDIQLVWVKLLCLAGRCNENGFLMVTRELPYTDEMLAKRFDMDIGIIQRALSIFQSMGMIEVEDNIYMVSNWLKYQSADKLSEIREKGRKRQREYRERQVAASLIPVKGEKCAYCGKDATTVDHIIPKSKNGTDDKDNLVPACKSCNSSKYDKDLVDFLNDDLKYGNRLDHDLIRKNDKLMKFVEFNEKTLRYCNVTVTPFCSISISNKHNFNTNNNLDNYKYLISNDIYKDSSYIKSRPELDAIISDWMTYKDGVTPKNKGKYVSQMSMSKVLTMVINHDKEYGTDAVREAVDMSIANQWVGIYWDKIEKRGYSKPMSEPRAEMPTGLEKPKGGRQ